MGIQNPYWFLLALGPALMTLHVQGHLVNNYDQYFSFTCPHRNEFLHRIHSIHSNRKEDRLFDLDCAKLPNHWTARCGWNSYRNGLDAIMVFACPGEGFIGGMNSKHYNKEEDRIYQFFCCSVPNTWAHNCYYTGWVNGFDGTFTYTVPGGRVLKGIVSYHSNRHEDRRFQFLICDLHNKGK